MLTNPASANSLSSDDVISGVSSKPVSLIGFGRPAFGYTLMNTSDLAASSSMYGRISAAPSAQLSPTDSGRAWRTEFQNASTVWPERMRPDASVTVPLIITGTRAPRRSNSASTAKIAALAFSVSKMVSISSRSAPPSSRPRACSP
jgi:hypothetical protein